MELISRRSAIMALTKQMSDWNDDRNKIVEQCIGAIRGLKVHDSKERKTGHWVEGKINEWSIKVFCSECGCPSPFEHISNGDIYSAGGCGVINKTKFCPNCGAKMEEVEK